MLRMLKATTALLFSGIYGALVGLIAATIIGFVFGSVVGLPFGFAAAFLGLAVGSRRGWMFSGGLMGLIGGVLIYNGMVAYWPGTLGELAWMVYLTFAPTLVGLYLGSKTARSLNVDSDSNQRKAHSLDFL